MQMMILRVFVVKFVLILNIKLNLTTIYGTIIERIMGGRPWLDFLLILT